MSAIRVLLADDHGVVRKGLRFLIEQEEDIAVVGEAQDGREAVRMAKEAIDSGLEMDQERAGRYEAGLFGLCFASADQKEGMQAFLEKRPAKFSGQ